MNACGCEKLQLLLNAFLKICSKQALGCLPKDLMGLSTKTDDLTAPNVNSTRRAVQQAPKYRMVDPD